ncbi:MAG: DUF4115 domain-containing protein [Atopostipes sp.]|nr:DUF4115 domain-containing protein [Atopostipes sp.]
MDEIGEILKQARIEKGYTLDDLQQITKIQKRYLEAVENGNTEVLPGKFYARAFVKQYADIVGLNGEELLTEYFEMDSENEDLAESLSSSPTRTKIEKNSLFTETKELLPTILIFILVAAILIVIYFAFRQKGIDNGTDSSMISDEQNEELVNSEKDDQENIEEEPQDNDSESEEIEEEETEEEEEAENSEINIEISDSTEDLTTYEVSSSQSEEQNIILETNDGQSWISIQVDGETVESTTLSADDSISTELDGDVGTVSLRIGNADVTDIMLDDIELEYGENSQGTVQNMEINFLE